MEGADSVGPTDFTVGVVRSEVAAVWLEKTAEEATVDFVMVAVMAPFVIVLSSGP